jgi:GTPase Era involved in 16S rRNA processing
MIIVINKTDKVKKQILEKTKKQAKELFFWQVITTYSSKTGKQKKELLNLILKD